MSIPKKIIAFLKGNKIKSQIIKHRTVYTAYDKAQTLRVPEKNIGKTLIIKMDRDFAIVLIGADKILDKGKFKKVVNNRQKKICQKPIKSIDFATEVWMKKNLKGVKVGAVPPFGNLWGLSTFVDKSLFKNREIIVSAGDYNFSVKINPSIFKKLIPDLILGDFGKRK